MLVDPRGISACGMNYSEDRIRADKIPRHDWRATRLGISLESLVVNRGEPSIRQPGIRRSAVQLQIVDVDALVKIGRGPGRWSIGCARTFPQATAGGFCWRIEGPVICDVVVNAGALRVPPVISAVSPGKESEGLEEVTLTKLIAVGLSAARFGQYGWPPFTPAMPFAQL